MRQRIFQILVLFNLCVLGVVVFLGISNKNLFKSIETQELIVRSPESKSYVQISFFEKTPKLTFFDDKGISRYEVSGGKNPVMEFKNSQNKVLAKMICEEEGAALSLHSKSGNQNIQLLSGSETGIYLKNPADKIVGVWTVLNDGGSGIGLAYADGVAASMLRGGNNPGVAFFHKGDEPSAALGIMKSVPHLMIAGEDQNESILIHGGKPAGMMVVDELGQLKIFISKYGLFQGKAKPEESKAPEKPKLFSSNEDKKTLFPEQEKTTR